ncbi:MAG: hypothetical protein IH614_15670 [Desulfuromonadales bacterium]|nr:hypothetical protein [Desulfuromonadales bacterium]
MVAQIATATREQSSGTVLITQAAEKMRELTLQVKTSTFEQNSSGKVIARSMEEITEMIRKIHRACDEQIRGRRQIVEATEGIRASSEVSVESSGVLDGAALSLGQQTAVMRKEMEVFRLRDQRQGPISPG